jgi:hypothetical protein
MTGPRQVDGPGDKRGCNAHEKQNSAKSKIVGKFAGRARRSLGPRADRTLFELGLGCAKDLASQMAGKILPSGP